MSPITCNIENPPILLSDKCYLRFVLPFNIELLVYDDFTTLTAIKLEFDNMSDAEQRAFLNAFIAKKLSP